MKQSSLAFLLAGMMSLMLFATGADANDARSGSEGSDAQSEQGSCYGKTPSLSSVLRRRPPPPVCPASCLSWFDGCNTCQCKNGKFTSCTKRACKKKAAAYCKKPVPLTCATKKCRTPRLCVMIKNQPRCQCPKLAIRCAKGFLSLFKVVNGCKIPYCRKKK